MKKVFSFILMAVCAISLVNADTQVTVDCGGSAKITATPQTGYHFVRWNDDNTENPRTLTDIQGDATYKAFFAINQYTITFKNWDGTVLQTNTYNHGETVTAPTATRPADAQYTYVFDAWTPNVNYTAEADAEYTATYTTTVNKYLIKFVNWDGTVLQSSMVEYGTIPTYDGTTPTKPADAENIYTFTGWDVTPVAVNGEATYTATFGTTTQTYNVSFAAENGTITGATDGTYQYGTSLTFKAEPAACYKFVGWSDGVTDAERTVTVAGNITYTAIFEKITYTITVESDDDTQGTVSVQKL